MFEPRLQSALAHKPGRKGAEGLAIQLREIDDRGMIDLRGNGRSRHFSAAVLQVLGVKPPVKPRSVAYAGDGEICVIWLSPDQWLILCPLAQTTTLCEALSVALSRQHAFVVDVSSARCILRLEGEGCREILMKAAPVDLTLPSYGAGLARRISFAEIAALIHIVQTDPDIIDLFIFRSYADYAWEWIIQTAGPQAALKLFGAQEPPPV